MHTDKHIYLLLGADPEFLGLLTDGLRIAGPYDFEAIAGFGVSVSGGQRVKFARADQ